MNVESLGGYGLVAAATAVLVEVLKRVPGIQARRAWLAPLLAVVLGLVLALAIVGLDAETALRGAVAGAVSAWGYDAVAGLAWRRTGGLKNLTAENAEKKGDRL